MSGEVVVVCGGRSLERGVSLVSGRRATQALRALGFEARLLDVEATLVAELRSSRPQFVFNAMHGRSGEDGTLQDLFEILGIPYTGSGVRASALCLDKHAFKGMCVAEALPTPAWHSFNRAAFTDCGAGAALPDLVDELGLPLIVKPAREGSSLGLRVVTDLAGFLPAVVGAFSYDDRIVIERYVSGRELAVTIVGSPNSPAVLPVVEILSSDSFYSFTAHYELGQAQLSAADLGAQRESVEDYARRAFQLAGCRDLARVDMILDADGTPQILEINTVPGLTETGPTPFAYGLAGMTFNDMVAQVIERVRGLA